MNRNYKRSQWKYKKIKKINDNSDTFNIHNIITPNLVGQRVNWFKGSKYCEIVIKKGHINYKLSRLRTS